MSEISNIQMWINCGGQDYENYLGFYSWYDCGVNIIFRNMASDIIIKMKQRKAYYSRKAGKIIIEEKITRYNKPYNKYLATLPEPLIMLNLLEYLKGDEKFKHLFRKKRKKCQECSKTAYLKNGFCLQCRKLKEDPDYLMKKAIEKKFKIPYDLYVQLKKSCFICGFTGYIEIHHLNKNHQDNREENLVGLCANHHKMIHTKKHEEELLDSIENKLSEIVKKNEENKIEKTSKEMKTTYRNERTKGKLIKPSKKVRSTNIVRTEEIHDKLDEFDPDDLIEEIKEKKK